MGKKAGGDNSAAKTHNNKAGSNSNRTTMTIDPDIIYFTHARIRPVFTGCNKRIQDTIDEIKNGVTKVTDIPYITIIENFESVYVQEPTTGGKGKAQNKGQNKRNARRGDDGTTDEEDVFRDTKGKKGGKQSAPATTQQSFYFSLNNRRLFLFKTLKSMGLVDTITVYVKPALEREKLRYTRQRCALMAKIMSSKELAEAGDEEPDEGEEVVVGKKEVGGEKKNDSGDKKDVPPAPDDKTTEVPAKNQMDDKGKGKKPVPEEDSE